MAAGALLVTSRAETGVDLSDFDREGFVLLDERLDSTALERMRCELQRVLGLRAEVMARQGVLQRTAGTGHHLLERDSAFVQWLSWLAEAAATRMVAESLGGKPVLNSFGAVDNRKGSDQYVGSVHRDVRTYTSERRTMVQLLVALDDFLPETGATWLLPGSHRSPDKPSDAAFFDGAVQVSAEAGRLIFFDSRIWHAAGINTTDRPRRALTLTFTRSFLKPQFDYSRYLGYDYVASLPLPTQQLLGFFSRVPATLEEWYQPPERRFYRPGQD